MAKKKSQVKKHRFKHAEPNAISSELAVSEVSQSTTFIPPAGNRVRLVSGAEGRDFSYVSGDLKRILIMAVALVLLEVVLWYLMTYTGVGSAVYRLVQV